MISSEERRERRRKDGSDGERSEEGSDGGREEARSQRRIVKVRGRKPGKEGWTKEVDEREGM